MDCTVSHSCSCRVNVGCGIGALLLRMMRGKKGRKMTSVSTQTDAYLIDVLVARRLGERIGPHASCNRVTAPPPPPDRKKGRHSSRVPQSSKSNIGPFAPTMEELTKGRASLRPVKSVPNITNVDSTAGNAAALAASQSCKEDTSPSQTPLNEMVFKATSAPPNNAPSVSEIIAESTTSESK